jgi:D-alanyl-lipoteichoic acid acyltransferase DltB (MBOAT superfamily)
MHSIVHCFKESYLLLFNSYEFIFLFLPITFFIYFYLNAKKLTTASKAFLVLASLFFYAWWNIKYLPLILISLLVNYTLGKELIKESQFPKKTLLIVGITFNLALLGYFKYSDFFLMNLNRLGTEIPLLHLALPLAISFYTFQQIAYLVDSYRGETKEYDFLNYAVFVTFFPQLIAGPIVHHSEMMPQFAQLKNKIKNYYHIALGLFIFAMGLFKKVVIADTFAIWATKGFDQAPVLNMLEAWATSLSYTFQLYFDFSGYTDMAIGAALLFNIKLPINFNSPYKATSIQDFWRRWHITLSRFLRNYIYIPLGGNRKGDLRTYTNLFTTFLLGGIWHGAGWTFVAWGILHGLGLIVHRIWSQLLGFRLWNWLAWFITFNFINITWVFFRANNFESALKVLKGMFFGDLILPASLSTFTLPWKEWGITLGKWSKLYYSETYMNLWLLATLLVVLLLPNSMQLKERFKTNWFYLLFTVILFTAIFMLHRKSEFIYFNF